MLLFKQHSNIVHVSWNFFKGKIICGCSAAFHSLFKGDTPEKHSNATLCNESNERSQPTLLGGQLHLKSFMYTRGVTALAI